MVKNKPTILDALKLFLYSSNQTESISTAPQLTRAKESFRESAGDSVAKDGKRFSVILIKEGLGNLKDCAYYTRGALQKAASDGIFEGKKLYVDHPSASEEEDRPERSVKDVGGYFENVRFEIEGDRSHLAGDLVILSGASFDQSRSLIRESVAYSEKHEGDLIGLSINANGDADAVPFDEFLKTTTIPSAVLPKLEKAQSQGATVIRVVKQIESAVSCDLVTEAGAGGRVVKMLEQEKRMAKKIVEAEEKKEAFPPKADKSGDSAAPVKAEAEETKEVEEDDKADSADDADAEKHDDEDQDKELIKKMIKKHAPDDKTDEKDEAACHEAHKAATEMGMEGEEAEKAAVYSMKMAKHAKSKQEAKEAEEKKEAEEGEEKKEAGEGLTPAVGGLKPGKTGAIHAESNKVIKLTAEVSKLRETVKTFENAKHLDKTLRESGLPMSVTKEFRKLAQGCKSEKEINEKFQVFNEAYKLGGGEASGYGFVVTSEKQENDLSQSGPKSYEDCVE